MNENNTNFPDAEAAGLSYEAIEMIAGHVRDVFNFKTGDDTRELVESLGCNISVTSPQERRLDIHGTIEVTAPAKWSVYLSSHTGPLQDRFTLAHELGHYVLHSKMGESPIKASRTFYTNSTPDLVEQEADFFALELLVPKNEFTDAIKQYGNDRNILAALFAVPASVIDVREKYLDTNCVR